MPFEMSACHSRELLHWQGDFLDGRNSPYTKWLKAGQWTDDTKMAKALAESLLAESTYSPADAARRYLAWYQSGDLRGIGTSTQAAMVKLASGIPWSQSGMPDAEGNGSAMRAAPIGLLFRYDIQAAAEMAAIDARLTHKTVEAEAGSMAVAAGVSALLQGASPRTVIRKALEWVPEKTQMKFRLMAAEARTLPTRPERELAETLCDMGTSGHVIDTVPAAFMAFASTKTFREAVRAAILAGGDTDTTAAITGALAGTYYGIEQVAPFLEKIEAAQELRDLEQNLFAAARPVYR
jgi:ADP-ribosyl-[dinitrogen reductase] hydrolase